MSIKNTTPKAIKIQRDGGKGTGAAHRDTGVNATLEQAHDPRGNKVYGDSPKVRSMGQGHAQTHKVQKTPIARKGPCGIE